MMFFTLNTKQTRRLSISICLCTLTLTGCPAVSKDDSSSDVAATKADAVDRVTAGPPVKKTLQLFSEQPGRVMAYEETSLLAKISGYVDTVNCDIGDKVNRGQVVVTIEAPEYQNLLEQKQGLLQQTEAQIRQAEASLVAMEAAANSAKAAVVQAEAGIGRADAEYARWQSELKRIEQLVTKGSVTPKLADETTSQFRAAESAKQEALANIESAKAKEREANAKVLSAKTDIQAAQSKLQVSRAEVANAQIMLGYTNLVAPFDGIVTQRKVDRGHYVQPAGNNNAAPLLTIANVSKVRVLVSVPESEAGWVTASQSNSTPGDSVTISAPSLPGGKLEARVTRTSAQLDQQSRTLLTEMELDNADHKLLPGAFVTAKILLEQRENVLTLPTSAIVKTNDGIHCCIVVDKSIQHRPIELGLRVGEEVEIKSGLDGTETVVLLRAGALKPNQTVEVIAKK